MGLKVIDPKGKSHRTAAVVDGDAFASNSTYAERVRRFAASVNGNQIKVDFFVRNGDNLVRADAETLELLASPEPESDGTTAIEALTNAGYHVVVPLIKGAV